MGGFSSALSVIGKLGKTAQNAGAALQHKAPPASEPEKEPAPKNKKWTGGSVGGVSDPALGKISAIPKAAAPSMKKGGPVKKTGVYLLHKGEHVTPKGKLSDALDGLGGETVKAKSGKVIKLNPPSKGHAPKGAHGRAAVKALGRTRTTGNFAKIEKAAGKGAAINAYQNALKAHKG